MLTLLMEVKTCIVCNHASQNEFESVLMQGNKVVVFTSQQLKPYESLKYLPTRDLETYSHGLH